MQTIKLHNSVEMPLVGSGTNTFGKMNQDYNAPINGDTTELMSAISLGYRHFDTAVSYRNESVLGKALEESVIPRDSFFLTTKIPGRSPHIDSREAVEETIAESLNNLGTDYIDLFLIHHPWDDMDHMLKVWTVLEEYYEAGRFKAIGVSNFTIPQLETFIKESRIKPMVNQIESHPGHWNDEVIDFCQSQEIVVQAWSPLNFVDAAQIDVLSQIGNQYGKTWAQVVLNYQIRRDVVVLPKSHNPKNQAANLAIFNFELSDEDKEQIRKL